jgi:hypothetical protein
MQASVGISCQSEGDMSYASSADEKISDLARLDLESLRTAWKQEYGKPPVGRLSRELLSRALAWQLQANRYGGLSKAVIRARATQVAVLQSTGSVSGAQPAAYKAGTKLIREWQGQVHEVIVLDDGYRWAGGHYKSLSQIARCITGTRWSGPRFFGLEKSGVAKRSGVSRHA